MAALNTLLGQLRTITTVLDDKLNDPSQNDVDNTPYNTIDDACDNISKCRHLKAFRRIMEHYKSNQLNFEDMNPTKTLDDFLHLLSVHNDDEAFESIYDALGGHCEAMKCNMYRNNHRNRAHESDKKGQSIETAESVIPQLLDRFHCHFMHCYDIGNRLNQKERSMIRSQMNHNLDDTPSRFVTMQKIINNKQHAAYRQMRAGKFYSAVAQNKDYEHKVQPKPDPIQSNDDDKVYHVGLKFDYKYSNVQDDMVPTDDIDIEIKRKYKSLKEEMTQNEIQRLTMQQFNNEYHKASIHYKSAYCKQLKSKLSDKVEQHLSAQKTNNNPEEWSPNEYGHTLIRTNLSVFNKESVGRQLVVSHLLAVLLYCNYDALCYEFSATYRPITSGEGMKSIAERHRNFWWFAKWLKECVNWFGTEVNDCNVETFYHGISEEMLVPLYEFQINGPLSSSASFCVAINFTNHNQGLIVEFEGRHSENFTKENKKCFSCSWLSDYGNEKEFLFLQHVHRYALITCNIIHCGSGTEYRDMLCALQHLNNMMFFMADESIQNSAASLVEHALGIKTGDILQPYGQRIWKHFCDEMKVVDIVDVETMSSWEPRLGNVFRCKEREWIRMDHILKLYPNVESIRVCGVRLLTVWILEDILKHYKDIEKNNRSVSLRMEVEFEQEAIALKEIMTKYNAQFIREVGYGLSVEKGYRKSLKIDKILND